MICGVGCGLGFGGSSPWTPAALGAVREADWDYETLAAGRVAAWNDTAKAHHWAQATAEDQPLCDADGVLFDAANTEQLTLTGGALISGIAQAHAFLIFKLTADPTVGTNDGLWKFGNSVDTRFPFSGDGIIYDEFANNSRKTAGNPTPNLAAAWHCYEVFSGAGDWQAWVDGTALSPSVANTVAWAAVTQRLGCSGTSYLAGRIKRLIIANQKLTGGTLVSMKGYLAGKYGLTFA